MAPVRKDDAAIEEGDQAGLAGRTKRAGGGEFTRGERVLSRGQGGEDAGLRLAVVFARTVGGVPDAKGIDGLFGDTVMVE